MSSQPLNIALVSSEIIPFAKTGGLADVCGTLPLELAKLGHKPISFMPAYRSVIENFQLKVIGDELQIPVGKKTVNGRILKAQLPVPQSRDAQSGDEQSDAEDQTKTTDVYFIQQSDYFDRPQIYGENGQDYADNCERFVFFCRAVMETIRILELPVDLIHANDWQAGLMPAYLKTEYKNVPPFENVPCVFTVHNLAYQGRFWHWDMLLTGLDWKYFNWQQMEFYGQLNLLKTGLVFADQITTVSPQYAKEIQTDELGCGLQGCLKSRSARISGIMNGIDTDTWNPQTDSHLFTNYDVTNWQDGKQANKVALQKELGLEVDGNIPLIGLVGRLASQKGWSILMPVIEQWLSTIDVQWAILGTGDPQFENYLGELSRRYPNRLAVRMEFSDRMAHLIEAASDLFVMPSQYEPCGLNQLYSLRYGTVPVVRHTGGLADSITDATVENLKNKTANGFSFSQFLSTDLETALARAVVCYMDDRKHWQQLVETGMKQDWSWQNSANQYAGLYQKAISSLNSSGQATLS